MSVSIPAADSYAPYKATVPYTIPEGAEILVQCYTDATGKLDVLHVAFRVKASHTWSPPIECVPA